MIDKRELSEEDIKNRFITPAVEAAGWDKTSYLMERNVCLTDGRIVTHGRMHMRRPRLVADYVLYLDANHPFAVVEAKDNKHPVGAGLQQAIAYAEKLDAVFAYSSNGDGFREHNMITGEERTLALHEFPNRREQEALFWAWKDLTPEARKAVEEPFYYDIDSFPPRYYQRIAINRTVEAVARGQKRILLVMATGTGKTYTAFQIIHRLRKSGCKQNVLYLADRNVLIDQTMIGDFKPFTKVMTKIQGKKIDEAYQIHMSLYGQLVNPEGGCQPYEDFSRDFFDLIIVDECHRGSVREDSEWKSILSYFSSATQIGMTATPKDAEGASNIDYFCTESDGKPLYTYSLRQGIEDGFLAPYRVTESFLSVDLEGWRPEPDEKDLYDNLIEQRVYGRKEFGRKIAIETRRKIVAHRITQMLKDIGRMTKTIVFCPDQEEASTMRDLLAELNADMMAKDPRYVMRITSDDKFGKKQLENFQDDDERYPTVVTTSELLTTGVNCKTCGLIVIDKEVESMTTFKQMVGRGTRIKEEKGKYHFEILDFRNVTRKFDDPAFDDVADETKVYSRPKSGGEPPAVSSDNPPEPQDGPSKYHVKGSKVTITHEVVKYLGADGKLKTESLTDYTKKAIRGRFATLQDFVRHWSAADRKAAVLEELRDCDIPLLIEAVRAENPALADKDVFDIIVHVAFDQKPLTRRERAENVKKRNYLAKYEGKAREVLSALLDKYADAERGVLEIEDDNIWELPPFNAIGTTPRIAGLFGGFPQLDAALRGLEDELYKEAHG